MNNKSSIDHSSQKTFHFKDYLEVLRSRSKHRDESQTKPRKKSPLIPTPMKKDIPDETEELLQLKKRYVVLEDKYKELLEKVRMRNLERQQMKEEIKTYQKMHERDCQQIERLRCIIGLINRKTVETQVNEEELEWNHLFRNSRSNKFDQSTEDDIKLKLTAQAFNKKEKSPSKSPKKTNKHYLEYSFFGKANGREDRQRTTVDRTGGILNKIEKQLKRVGSGKRLSNSPYSQLRFVPGAQKK